MNLFVLLALVLIAVFTVMGFRVGLVRRVLEFAGLVASFLLASRLAPAWRDSVAETTGLQEKVALYVAWVVIFLLGLIATRLVAWLITKTVRISVVGWLDRLGGALFGLLMGTILASVLTIAVSEVPGGKPVREAFNENALSRNVYQAAPWLLEQFRRLGGDPQKIWERVVQEWERPT